MKVIEFLNTLAFYKDKAEQEEARRQQQARKWR